MIAYKENKAPVVTRGGVVLVAFDGETAKVDESTGKILKGLGYRVEDNGESEGTVENADTGHKGRGRGVSARNSESGD